jgi:photosystem II stability/assembly factor-like uncharacterized protein
VILSLFSCPVALFLPGRVLSLLIVLLGLLPSDYVFAGLNQWTSNGPEGNTVPGFSTVGIDPKTPQTIYVGGYSLYKSIDGGSTWSKKLGTPFGSRGVRALAINPQASDVLYVGTYGRLLKSTDGAESWTDLNFKLDQGDFDDFPSEFICLAIDPVTPTTVFASVSDPYAYVRGLFKSTDGGASWTPLSNGIGGTYVRILLIDSGNPTTIYAGTWDQGVLKSVDGGANWLAMNLGLPSIPSIHALAADPFDRGILYAGVNVMRVDDQGPIVGYLLTPGGLFKSTNGGAEWSPTNLQDLWITSLAVDPANPAILYAGTWGSGVQKSPDGGTSWTESGLRWEKGVVHAMAIHPATPSIIYAATDRGVFHSIDGGISWADTNNGLAITSINSLSIDSTTGETIVAGTGGRGGLMSERQSGSIFKSSDNGTSWIDIGRELAIYDVWDVAIDPKDPNIFHAATDAGVFKSTNGGINWLPIRERDSDYCESTFLAIDPLTPSTVFSGSQFLYRSVDGGREWTRLRTGLPEAGCLQCIEINPANTDVIYAGSSNGVYKSVDGGENWTEMGSGVIQAPVRSLSISPISPNTLYAAGEGFFKSVDGGTSWVKTDWGLSRVNSINAVVTDPVTAGIVYAATDRGVFMSSTGGQSWSAINTGLTSLRISSLAVDPTGAVIHAGSDGDGVFSLQLEPKPSSPELEINLYLNHKALWPGDTLQIGLGVWNSGESFNADCYFGLLLPDADTLVFVTSLNPHVFATSSLHSDPRSFSPLAANLEVPADLDLISSDFFASPLPDGISRGEYYPFVVLFRPGAFQDGVIDDGDIILSVVESFFFQP